MIVFFCYMVKTYVFKLMRSKRSRYLDDSINECCRIYNRCIMMHRRYYSLFGRRLNKYMLQKHITKLKKRAEFASWNAVNSQSIQQITDRIDVAYNLFYENLKRNIKCAPPGFKRSDRYNSYTLKRSGYKFDVCSNVVYIGGHKFKYYKSRDVHGVIKALTIKRIRGEFYIYVNVKNTANPEPPVKRGSCVGFDYGIRVFLTASDGNDINVDLILRSYIDRVRCLSAKRSDIPMSVSRKKKLSRLHKKITNKRADMHWKLAHMLCEKYDYMFFETLSTRSMAKSLQNVIRDHAFASFLCKLSHIAIKRGKHVYCIDKWYPSTQTCSTCLVRNDRLKLGERTFNCNHCGKSIPRDYNAAINIERVGASTLGLKHDAIRHRVSRIPKKRRKCAN